MVEPRVLRHERAEAERADDEADEDEPDDRRDAEPGEGRDDDAGGTEDYESVGKGCCRFEIACHPRRLGEGGSGVTRFRMSNCCLNHGVLITHEL